MPTYNVDKYAIMIKNSQLRNIIDQIDKIIIQKDQTITRDEIYCLTWEFYDVILKANEDIFSDVEFDEPAIKVINFV